MARGDGLVEGLLHIGQQVVVAVELQTCRPRLDDSVLGLELHAMTAKLAVDALAAHEAGKTRASVND